jgi:hypothetical protein
MKPEISPQALSIKQQQFNAAMEKYESNKRYAAIRILVSVINVSFQPVLLFMVFQHQIGIASHLLACLCAYVLADLVNGVVHMLMDNDDKYTGFSGPFIAAFHLHHRTPVYKKRNVFLVYFLESGSKVWLAIYFLALAVAMGVMNINPLISYILVYFGIFSCVAEVSHYYAHTPNTPVPAFLARTGLLLSKRYHVKHHMLDNCRYAFLNGMTDPLLNLIAKKFFNGYKMTTDLHYAQYSGKGTSNRD